MKQFLIIGNLNCVSYADVIPSIKRGEVWFGEGKNLDFYLPDGTLKGATSRWYTNIGKNNRKPLQLTEHYSPEKYKHYDNYEAIEVGKVKHIPCDYYGEMGVPATFLDRHCPEQFEIVGFYNDFRTEFEGGIFGFPVYINEKHPRWQGPSVNFKGKYFRIIIKRKKNVYKN